MRIRIKICGITTAQDAIAAAELGADAVGLNFHPGSPRCIDAATARATLDVLPPFVQAVGVFVDRPLAKVAEFLAGLPGIELIQMHGTRREVPAPSLARRLIPAFQVRDEADLAGLDDHLDTCRASGAALRAVLIDGHAPGLAGGTGRTGPWGLLADPRLER